MLIDGTVAVTKDGKKVAELKGGDWLGEIALLTEKPRTATVTASSPVDVLVITDRRFRNVVETMPSIALKVLSRGLYGPLFPFFLLGCLLLVTGQAPAQVPVPAAMALFLAVLTVFFCVVVPGTDYGARYMLPAIPCLLVVAAVSLEFLRVRVTPLFAAAGGLLTWLAASLIVRT